MKLVVSKFKQFVLYFQETKVDKIFRFFLRSIASSSIDKCHYIKSNGASGGFITCWCASEFSCSDVLIRRLSLTVRLKHKLSGNMFYLTNVYNPLSWEGKEEFCNELAALKDVFYGLWAMCGDFNLTRCQQERKGRCWSGKLMAMFSVLLNELELIDLPITNQNFMWSNMQCNPTLAKLDRFLISTEWDQTFPLSNVVALPRITSDHTPLLLSSSDKLVRRMFRFEEVWLKRDEFIKLMPVWWAETPR